MTRTFAVYRQQVLLPKSWSRLADVESSIAFLPRFYILMEEGWLPAGLCWHVHMGVLRKLYQKGRVSDGSNCNHVAALFIANH